MHICVSTCIRKCRQWILDYSLFGPAGQFQADELMAKWMMSEPVRSALHVTDSPAQQWPMIDEGFDYTSQYAACNPDAPPGTPSMIDFYREIAPKLSITVVGTLAALPPAPSPAPPYAQRRPDAPTGPACQRASPPLLCSNWPPIAWHSGASDVVLNRFTMEIRTHACRMRARARQSRV